jgi:Flp pilus assembly protein TadB
MSDSYLAFHKLFYGIAIVAIVAIVLYAFNDWRLYQRRRAERREQNREKRRTGK